jgi:thiol-disulfide isomerase/thioredoxin
MIVLGAGLLFLRGPTGARAEEEEETHEPQPKTAAPAVPVSTPAGARIEQSRQFRRSHNFSEALRVLGEARAMKLEPAHASEVLFEIANTHFGQGQEAIEGKISGVEADASLREAAKLFAELVKTYPQAARAQRAAYMVGSSHLLLDDLEVALPAYQRAFDDFPGSAERSGALLRVGVCQAGLDQPKKAAETFARVRREFPQAKFDAGKAAKYLDEMRLVGKPAPAIRTNEWLVGAVSDGLKDLKGQAIVLVFFATWCNHCKGNLPRLRHLMSEWSPQGVVFIGVANPDDPMNTEPVDVYVQTNRLEYHDVALDRTGASWIPYNVGGLPASVLIDRKGTVRWRGNLAFLPVPLLGKLVKE